MSQVCVRDAGVQDAVKIEKYQSHDGQVLVKRRDDTEDFSYEPGQAASARMA